MRIRLFVLLCLCSVGLARATPKTGNLPFTEKQFEMAVACIKHFEGWHNMKDYVGYGHQLQKGERRITWAMVTNYRKVNDTRHER